MFREGDKVKAKGQRGRVVAVNGKLIRVYIYNLGLSLTLFADDLEHIDG